MFRVVTLSGRMFIFQLALPVLHSSCSAELVCRYLSYDTTGKNIGAAEAKAPQSKGWNLVLVWEAGAEDALGGYARGLSEAKEADSQAKAVGMPSSRPITWARIPLPRARARARLPGHGSSRLFASLISIDAIRFELLFGLPMDRRADDREPDQDVEYRRTLGGGAPCRQVVALRLADDGALVYSLIK